MRNCSASVNEEAAAITDGVPGKFEWLGGVPDEFERLASDDMSFTPEGSTLAPAPPIGGFTSISHWSGRSFPVKVTLLMHPPLGKSAAETLYPGSVLSKT